MGFEDNPADDDPHGECRHEIHSLQARVTKLEAQCTQLTIWRDNAAVGLVVASKEAAAVIDTLGKDIVRVREGGGPENLWATLAVSVSKMKTRATNAEKSLAELKSRISDIARRIGPAASPSWVRDELERIIR